MFRYLLWIGFLFLASVQAQQTAPPSAPPSPIPADARWHNGKWYRAYLEEKTSWRAAEAKCQAVRGHLASVPDSATWMVLKQLAAGRILWLGATDEQSEGLWKWLNGKPVVFQAWGPRQPDNWRGIQHYLCTTRPGEWDDIQHDGDKFVIGYICEWDHATPATSITATAAAKATSLSAAPSGPAAEQISQLANFWNQLPDSAAWAAAPLDVKVPADLGQSFSSFKRGLAAESPRSVPAMQKAYGKAAILADLLATTYGARTQTLLKATGGAAVMPARPVLDYWAVMGRKHLGPFRRPGWMLEEAFREAGGLAKTTPVVSAEFPLAKIPPAPANLQRPDLTPEPVTFGVSATGPSGTNFGVGDRTMKIKVSAGSNSTKPVSATVECFWITLSADGRRHVANSFDRRSVTLSETGGADFEAATIAQRTNGATRGVLVTADPAGGRYRGWLVTIRDPAGKRCGAVANLPEFIRLAPP